MLRPRFSWQHFPYSSPLRSATLLCWPSRLDACEASEECRVLKLRMQKYIIVHLPCIQPHLKTTMQRCPPTALTIIRRVLPAFWSSHSARPNAWMGGFPRVSTVGRVSLGPGLPSSQLRCQRGFYDLHMDGLISFLACSLL